MVIYHGSEKIIKQPQFGFGTTANDFGRGFYCTENKELAGEWACKKNRDGFINAYELDTRTLQVMNLLDEQYHILNWLALLTRYRGYWQVKSIAEEAKNYLQENYLPDITGYDLIVGYRADDSYFSFAQDFVAGTISLQTLSRAMRLGKLGEQVVVKSRKAFDCLTFAESSEALKGEFFNRKCSRDLEARRNYAEEKKSADLKNDIYMIDILRGRVNEDDLRI